MGLSVDLNADLGERVAGWRPGDDEAVMASVTTAHIACGFHAGDPVTMFDTVAAAVRRGVVVGAHPSFPDREGFGRRPMQVDQHQIRLDVLYQVAALEGIAKAAGGQVASVKAHGALYNQMADDPAIASAVAAGVAAFSGELWLVVQAGSRGAAALAGSGLRVVEEAFCDRGYRSDGSLVPRDAPGAVLSDPASIAARAVEMVRHHRVPTAEGGWFEVAPATLCIHGDTPGAAAIAAAVRGALEEAGIEVRSFT